MVSPIDTSTSSALDVLDQRSPTMSTPGGTDLTNYIALGVLSVRNNLQYPVNDNWTEMSAADFKSANFTIVTEGRSASWNADIAALILHHWVRIFHGTDHSSPNDHHCLRIHVLPEDVARKDIPRQSSRLRRTLTALLKLPIDTSRTAWEGYKVKPDAARGSRASCCFQKQPDFADESLFYIFNTIASPDPETANMGDDWTCDAAQQVLEGKEKELGIKATLYPYQRRSIVSMMQRETLPQCSRDPRVEEYTGPTRQTYFFDRVTSEISIQAASYDEPRGGILAETMGYGKTLIALGLVAATKEQIAKTPIEHIETRPFTNKLGTRSLLSTAADFAVRHGLPWRQYFRDMAQQGIHFETCMRVLQTPPYYEMVLTPQRSTRQEPVVTRILLTKTTLVVVPPNLFDQWRAEIRKHLVPDALDILEVKDNGVEIGTPEQLARYDVILMDKRRFYMETIGPPDCTTPRHQFPLNKMHFLRMIVDEGHTFASTGTAGSGMQAVTQLRAERRWIVSGTPSNGLVGVEVDLAANSIDESVLSAGETNADVRAVQIEALKRRKQQRADDVKDLQRLGRIVTELLRAQPWCNAVHSGDSASWSAYTRVGIHYLGFYSAASVRSILQSLVVRHQIGDVEAELPPLTNKVVYLEPTVYDKASMDLFTFVLMNNAVTSERQDQDYLFHERNRKYLDNLIRNLRRAPFFWSGFAQSTIQKAVDIAKKYADEHPDLVETDKTILEQALRIIPAILDDKVWQAISESQEILVCVQNLPQVISAPLGVDNQSVSLMNGWGDLTWDKEKLSTTTATRLLAAQKFCRDNASLQDPIRELRDAVEKIANAPEHSDQVFSANNEKSGGPNENDPKNIAQLGDLQLTEKQFARHKSLGSVSKAKGKKRSIREVNKEAGHATDDPVIAAEDISLCGTLSAKFSYLLSRVKQLHKTEKILIFYEGDYIAWYMAQGLELLGIPHFIYANKIGSKLRNKYMETFMEKDCEERVMLIDLRQGSHGLNITAASRIFFINPVWHVGTEAQAIKRAHRIGQTKPVHVETLILKGSVEQKIFDRRRQMSSTEQAHASSNPLDDNVVHDILKNFEFYGGHDNIKAEDRYAPLDPMPTIFPELAESQAREGNGRGEQEASISLPTPMAPPAKQLDVGVSESSAGSTIMLESPLAKRVKKSVGFA